MIHNYEVHNEPNEPFDYQAVEGASVMNRHSVIL